VPRLSGEELAHIVTPVPGPRSRELARRLSRFESRNVTFISEAGPIFWTEAAGANVRDADGNVYIDLTAGFGVATAGHANAGVATAIAEQAARLPHALGDVHPAEIKVRLLERLAALAPGDLGVTLLASAGAEAVEAALKTALLRTDRPGILAFEGAYHGLTYGALAATWAPLFRAPFRSQLYGGVRFAPFPAESDGDAGTDAALRRVRELLDEAEPSDAPIGAILVEPIQGRGGLVVPGPRFLTGLRDLCDGESRVLIFDEVYTGFGRTGRWFACEHWNVVPDLMAVGKALTGSLPLSAVIGRAQVMDAWPRSSGEAMHTSTFLGNPIGCAAALAQLDEIDRRGLVSRADRLGDRIRSRVDRWIGRYSAARGARGRGLLQGVALASAAIADDVVQHALGNGVIVLTEGPLSDVLAITPSAVITDAQLDSALEILEQGLALAERNG
jgi:4-aminobutyrate aminotransferase/(S)-3-amino-2-methylpropionate transaminase